MIQRNVLGRHLARHATLRSHTFYQPFLRLLPCRGQSLIGFITPQMFCTAHHSVVSISASAYPESGSRSSMFAVFKVAVVISEMQLLPGITLSPCPVCASSLVSVSSFDGLPPADVKIQPAGSHSPAASALSEEHGGIRRSAMKGIDLHHVCQESSDCRVIFSIEWPVSTSKQLHSFVSVTQKLTAPSSTLIGTALVLHNPTAYVAELEVNRYISWFARPLSSSLSVTVNGVPTDAASVIRRGETSPRAASRALEWRSMGSDSFNISVPANSTILLHSFMERSYIHWERHQPDAHRGLDLPPLFVWHNSSVVAVDSPIFLVPLPDFSMP